MILMIVSGMLFCASIWVVLDSKTNSMEKVMGAYGILYSLYVFFVGSQL